MRALNREATQTTVSLSSIAICALAWALVVPQETSSELPPLFLTPVFSDSFSRANENPLNPATWLSITRPFPLDTLGIVSNVCTIPTPVNGEGDSSYIQSSLTADQYASLQVIRLTANGEFSISLRSNPGDVNFYAVTIIGGPSPKAFIELTLNFGAPNEFDFLWPTVSLNVSINDVFAFVVIGQSGGSWYLLQNGVQIATGLLNAAGQILAGPGTIAIDLRSLNPPFSSNDVGVGNFVAGNASLTPPPPSSGGGPIVLTPIHTPSEGRYYNIPAEYGTGSLGSFYRFINYPWAYQSLGQGASSGPIASVPLPPGT